MEERGYRPVNYETTPFRPARLGLDWRSAPDAAAPEAALIYDNLVPIPVGSPNVRAGQTAVSAVSAGAVNVHSLARLSRPRQGDFTRFWGAGTTLFRGRGQGDPIEAVLVGGSGFPATLLPYRPQLSGDPWLLIGDSSGMAQVPFTGAPQPLGLPAPGSALTTAVTDVVRTNVCSFDGTTAAANWTATPGYDRSDTPVLSGTPTAADTPALQGNGIAFTAVKGNATSAFASVFGCPRALNLTRLGDAGEYPASPDDLLNLWIRVDKPGSLEEVRVYFVCAAGFSPSIIPGQSPTVNQDAFVKAFRPSDFTGFIEGLQSAMEGAAITQQNQARQDYLDNVAPDIPLDNTPPLISLALPAAILALDPANPWLWLLALSLAIGAMAYGVPSPSGGTDAPQTRTSLEFSAGRNVWTQFGSFGKPLRRSDFTRIGATQNRGWDTITGIVLVIQTAEAVDVTVTCDDWFLTGGWGLDSSEVGATAYDWRYVHYNIDTGDVSNPSPEQSEANRLLMLRQRATLSPVAYSGPGDVSRIRQRFYRRGGTLTDDWYYVGQNSANGGTFIDDDSDLAVAASATLELDNDQPVPTVTSTGSTVTAQPIPAVWGPIDGVLFGCGDPYRPGHLYRSKPERPGSWPAANVVEVCSPSEELLNGCLYGSQAYVWSRRALYAITPNLVDGGQTVVQETACKKGLWTRWSFAVGPQGMAFVAQDGIYLTTGGAPQWLSEAIDPIFKGKSLQTEDGEVYAPAILTTDAALPNLRLTLYQQELFFHYQALDGTMQCLVYHFLLQQWRRYTFARPISVGLWEQEDPNAPLLLGGWQTGNAYTHEGLTDDGVPIVCRIMTPFLDGGLGRADKQLGDVVVDANLPTGATLSLVTRLNHGTVRNPVMPVAARTGRRRYQFDPFGEVPQRARTISLDLSWTHPAAGGTGAIYLAGISASPLPDQVYLRATQWEPLESTEVYLTGVIITADTNATPVNLSVEITQGANRQTAAALTLVTPGRRRMYFSWPAVKADQVRLRPTSACTPWMFYNVEWLYAKEPARIALWDTNWQELGDTYCTGIDLIANTLGATKRIQLQIDNVIQVNPATGLPYWEISSTVKQYFHLTLTPTRGHIYRMTALDLNAGLLYAWDWKVEGEPAEQANWNQNYTLAGTLTDKWVKGVILECDTFNQPKTVQIQGDGGVLATITAQANDRQVLQFSFPQAKARVLRLLPVDANPGRLYSLQWIYDEEPLRLSRWETQLIDHGLRGWHSPYRLFATLEGEAVVTLVITGYGQEGQVIASHTYTLPVSPAKRKHYVPLQAMKGVLFKYLFTSPSPFHLYREESVVVVLPWGSEQAIEVQPFGSDDLDKVRSLGNASGIAATPNNRPPQPRPTTEA